MPISVRVDHDGEFDGAALAIDDTTIDLRIDNDRFLQAFKEGYVADLFVLGVRWGVDLTGTASGLDRLVELVEE